MIKTGREEEDKGEGSGRRCVTQLETYSERKRGDSRKSG